MRTIPLEASATVTLDGSGNGVAVITPPVVEQWSVQYASINTSTSTKVPTAKLYVGPVASQSTFIDGTYNGSQNTSDALANYPIVGGVKIFCAWTGGDAGAIATLTVRGTKRVQ